jgi:hypothetical protein
MTSLSRQNDKYIFVKGSCEFVADVKGNRLAYLLCALGFKTKIVLKDATFKINKEAIR